MSKPARGLTGAQRERQRAKNKPYRENRRKRKAGDPINRTGLPALNLLPRIVPNQGSLRTLSVEQMLLDALTARGIEAEYEATRFELVYEGRYAAAAPDLLIKPLGLHLEIGIPATKIDKLARLRANFPGLCFAVIADSYILSLPADATAAQLLAWIVEMAARSETEGMLEGADDVYRQAAESALAQGASEAQAHACALRCARKLAGAGNFQPAQPLAWQASIAGTIQHIEAHKRGARLQLVTGTGPVDVLLMRSAPHWLKVGDRVHVPGMRSASCRHAKSRDVYLDERCTSPAAQAA
jgi:hypothetical protein